MGYEDIPTCGYGTQQVFENSKIQEPVPETVKSSTGGPVNYKREPTTNAADGFQNSYVDSVTYSISKKQSKNQSKERKKYARIERIKIFLIDGYVARYTDASIKITSKYIKIIDSSQIEIRIPLNIVREITLTDIVPIK